MNNINSLFDGIYKNKTILITGHTGFKGSWLALWLINLGAKVIGFSLKPPTIPNHFDNLNLKMDSIIGDIRDRSLLEKVIEEYKPDLIFHLAAQAIVNISYDDPISTFDVNIIGTANILDICRKIKNVKGVINVTSDKCYENQEWIWGYRETDVLGGYDPYSCSKSCSELITNSFRKTYFNHDEYKKSHNLLIATARAGNVVGGGDWAEYRIIPDIVKSYFKNEKVLIRNPFAVRPWQHVLEPLYGYLLLGEKLLLENINYADSWNFGPNNISIINVKQLLSIVNTLWSDFNFDLNEAINKKNIESQILKLDCSKANRLLKWNPIWDIEKTIKETLLWYEKFYQNSEIISIEQIFHYSDKILSRVERVNYDN